MRTELKEETKKVSELAPIKIGLNDDEFYTFYFRRPFAYESNEASAKFAESADLTGMDKGQKEFEIVKENLISFASRPVKFGEIENSIDGFFAEYTPENEAVVLQAWFEFQKKQLLRLNF